MTHPWKPIPLRLIPAALLMALCFGLYLRAEAGAKDLCLFLFNVIWIVTFLSFRRRSWPFSKTWDGPFGKPWCPPSRSPGEASNHIPPPSDRPSGRSFFFEISACLYYKHAVYEQDSPP